jgi:TonB family protein
MGDHRAVVETANDRFKQGSGDWFGYSVAAAAVFHLVMFAFWPNMTAADYTGQSDELTAIDLPPEIVIPPLPEQIARPATPVISDLDIDDDITIAPTTFDANPIDNLPPPPTSSSSNDDISRAPMFVVMTVRPQLLNTAQVERELIRNYPPLLRDAGVGGTPILWFHIDETGRVIQTRLHTSSGYTQLDEAAQKVAEHMRFSPALNRDRKIQVWVEIPVVFRSR